jgi:hypothetical protein
VSTFQSFTEIEAWQKARELTFRVYAVSKHGAFAKDFELRGQIRGASISCRILLKLHRMVLRNLFSFCNRCARLPVASQLYVANDWRRYHPRRVDELTLWRWNGP